MVEKPAVGGRMIARADGQVVLVAGAIPGERVRVRVERVVKGVAFAETIDVDQPSADRVAPSADPRCGGCLYAHVAYPRQLELKSSLVVDAFTRIGHISVPAPVVVVPSPVDGYRMRARLHARGGRIGFFREGTHELCDARTTRQLLPATSDAIERLTSALGTRGMELVRDLEVSENMEGSERVIHLEVDDAPGRGAAAALAGLVDTGSVSGVTAGVRYPPAVVAGDPRVTDTLVVGDRTVSLKRHVLAFFQGNRHLLPALVQHVLAQIGAAETVIELYAGVGLFSLPAAVRGARVTAVEGDRVAASDLHDNAREAGVHVVHKSVEAFTAVAQRAPAALLVDPPRTGMSRDALEGAIRLQAPRVVYVSCDMATLARDCRRFLDSGYAVRNVAAFDMFPRTPHVEAVVTLELLPPLGRRLDEPLEQRTELARPPEVLGVPLYSQAEA
jgi:23S rRNA (uracil1939-C5)-methyltransferase